MSEWKDLEDNEAGSVFKAVRLELSRGPMDPNPDDGLFNMGQMTATSALMDSIKPAAAAEFTSNHKDGQIGRLPLNFKITNFRVIYGEIDGVICSRWKDEETGLMVWITTFPNPGNSSFTFTSEDGEEWDLTQPITIMALESEYHFPMSMETLDSIL